MEIPSLVEAARQVRTVECSAAELFAEYLSSIERDNPVMNAFVHVDAPRAFALAARIDTAVRERRIDELRPLASAPFGVKELDDCWHANDARFAVVHETAAASRDAIHIGRMRAAVS